MMWFERSNYFDCNSGPEVVKARTGLAVLFRRYRHQMCL